MKTLYLLRHAKSSWETEGQRDFDRPLNPRGEAGALIMGAYCVREALAPDIIYCSPAVRTQETCARIRGVGVAWPAEIIADDIYMASAETLWSLVKSTPETANSVMVIGHNPGLEDLAFMLIAKGEPELRARLDEKFPTATLCALTFNADHWVDIEKKSGTLTTFTRPRDLGLSVEDDD
jgi:phosphohistidine phosphatase